MSRENIRGTSKNQRCWINVSFPRKRESSVYQYLLGLDPRFCGDDKRNFRVFRGALIILFICFVVLGGCGIKIPPYEPLVSDSYDEDDISLSTNADDEPDGAAAGDDEQAGEGDEEDSELLHEEEAAPGPPSYLMINEIYYDPAGTDTQGDVFIELYGEPGGNLDGFHLALVNGDDGKTYKTIPFDKEYIIAEDGIFVVADVGTDGRTKVFGADCLENFDPQNGPDSIQLIGKDGKIVDAVGYGNITIPKGQNGLPMYEGLPAGGASSGKSLSRPAGAEDTGDNSVDFAVNASPSPGVL